MTARELGPDGLVHPDYLEALRSMPKDDLGHVVDLAYVPERRLAAAEAAWRAWCRKTPRKYWPPFILAWAARRARERRKAGTDQKGVGGSP